MQSYQTQLFSKSGSPLDRKAHALRIGSNQSKPRSEITSDVRPTFVPVDVHKPPVLMCNYTGKEVV